MHNDSKVICPTCGATAKREDFGRDESPRELAPYLTPLSNDSRIVERRNRARLLRAKNAQAAA